MMDIHHITFRTIAAATEGEDRVRTALSLFLLDTEIETVATEGHYGNPIYILQAHIKGSLCSRFINLLKSKLSEHDLDRLKNELDERIDDECHLHVRFDKQAAYSGIVRLATITDTIHAQIKIRAYPARRENAIAVAEKVFALHPHDENHE